MERRARVEESDCRGSAGGDVLRTRRGGAAFASALRADRSGSDSPEFLDNTLVALRLGILDVRDSPSSERAWAGGVQVGPRLPTLPGSLGGAKFLSPDDDQLHLVGGPALKVVPTVELSAVALAGFLKGSDRLGTLLGVSTRFKAF